MGIRSSSGIRIVRDRIKAEPVISERKVVSRADLPFSVKLADKRLWKHLRPEEFPIYRPEPGKVAFEGNDVSLVWYGPSWPLVFVNGEYLPKSSVLYPDDIPGDGDQLETLAEILGARILNSEEVDSDEVDELIPSDDYDNVENYRFAFSDRSKNVVRISPDGKTMAAFAMAEGTGMDCDPAKHVPGTDEFDSICCFLDNINYQILYRDGKQIAVFNSDSYWGSETLRAFIRSLGGKLDGSYHPDLNGESGRLQILEETVFGDCRNRPITEVVAALPKLTPELKAKLQWAED